jgi:cell division protein FtsB
VVVLKRRRQLNDHDRLIEREVQLAVLVEKHEQLKREYDALEEENADLKAQIEQYEREIDHLKLDIKNILAMDGRE